MNDIDAIDKGQVGVSTLIVFIAMILIASISAGVLINTTTLLETQSAQTSEETNKQVTARAEVVGVAGNVTDQATVDWVNLTVKLGAGTDSVDLAEVTVQYIGPNGVETLTHTTGSPSDGEFVTEPFRDSDGSAPALNDPNDRAAIAIHLGQSDVQLAPLDPEERATVKITTSSGGTTRVRIVAPEGLDGDSSVAL